MKKTYQSPQFHIEPLEVDASYALACSTSIGATTIACLEPVAPNEFEELVFGLGLTVDTPLDSTGYAFSDSITCIVSCYQGPYDLFFNS